MSARDALLGEQLEAVREVHPQEARLARRPRRANSSKRSSAAGSRSMQTSVPGRADPVGDQARVAAVAEGAVDGDLARAADRAARSARRPGPVRAARVMSRRMAKALCDLGDSAVKAPPAAPSVARPRPRGGRGRRSGRRPSRSPRARGATRSASPGRPSRAPCRRSCPEVARQLLVLAGSCGLSLRRKLVAEGLEPLAA